MQKEKNYFFSATLKKPLKNMNSVQINPLTINCRGKLIDLSSPIVMGILNATDDSFYSASRCNCPQAAGERAEQIIKEGGAIIDIGGFSTRPGAQDVSTQEETDRVCAAVEITRSISKSIPVSVDTFRPKVAQAAVAAGADIINDISGGEIIETSNDSSDKERTPNDMFRTAAALHTPYILTHTRGNTLQQMQQKQEYGNVTNDIFVYFAQKTDQLHRLGVCDIILDPGFGFAKDTVQGYELMAGMHLLKQLGLPILAGISRKRMVWQVAGGTPDDCLNPTTALNTIALMQGAHILRVHDVKQANEAVMIYNAYRHYGQSSNI